MINSRYIHVLQYNNMRRGKDVTCNNTRFSGNFQRDKFLLKLLSIYDSNWQNLEDDWQMTFITHH